MLRITSGELRNRRIEVPKGGMIRPMLEKPRQALFSILGQDVTEGRPVLDCFAGTGVLGFEALSRGASHATFIDIESSHVKTIGALATTFGCMERVTVMRGDAFKLLTPHSALRTPSSLDLSTPHSALRTPSSLDLSTPHSVLRTPHSSMRLIFVDPPHALVEERSEAFLAWFEGLANAEFVGDDTLVVYGHHERDVTPEQAGRWRRFERRDYGNVALSLYERA